MAKAVGEVLRTLEMAKAVGGVGGVGDRLSYCL